MRYISALWGNVKVKSNNVISDDGMDFQANNPVRLGIPSTIDSNTENSLLPKSHTHKLGDIDISSIVQSNGYGALYNWYVTQDSKKISSSDDWVVPSKSIIEGLFNYIDTYDSENNEWLLAGGKLKEIGYAHWNSPNTGATNEVGFGAVGSGFRNYGIFQDVKRTLTTWSNTIYTAGLYSFVFECNARGSNTSLYGHDVGDGCSIRLCNPSITTEGATGIYIGNDGKEYQYKVIGGIAWLTKNLNETQFRDSSWISGYDGGVYTPISNADWQSRGTAGESLMCYYDDNELLGGGAIPLADLIISEHNKLKGLDGGDPENNYYGHLTPAEKTLIESFISLPTYVDNGDAITGGLQPGQLYKTSSGNLMVVYIE